MVSFDSRTRRIRDRTATPAARTRIVQRPAPPPRRRRWRITAPALIFLITSLATLVVASSETGRANAVSDGSSDPNVLIIVTDDQRVGTLKDVMPETLEVFRDGGTYYSNAFVTTPDCCPSRASILTGRYAHNHDVRTNGNAAMLDHRTTLQYRLQTDGYSTAIFGKLLNRWVAVHNPPYWDRWSVFSERKQSRRYYYEGMWNDQGRIRPVLRYSTTYIGDRAVSFIKQSEVDDARPWFLYLGVLAPHSPFIPEPKYADAGVPPFVLQPEMRERDYRDKPGYVQRYVSRHPNSLKGGTEHRTQQLRTLMSVDDLVEKVFQALSTAREARDTLAIFLSDNGYLWGDHGLNRKKFPYTWSIRTPLFIRWPGHVPAGGRDERIAANIDVAPTVLEAAGLTADGLDGSSLVGPSDRERILTESWRDPHWMTPTWASIRGRSYQYIETYDREGDVAFREYYDLKDDPAQLVNVLHDGRRNNNPDVEALSALLSSDRQCTAGTCP